MRNQGVAKWIFVGNLLMFAGLLSVSATAFTRQPPAILSVERLNIVDAVGHVLLVLSNGARLPGASFAGKEYPQSFVGRGKSAGMIFLNEAGDEVGGLIYEGERRDSTYRAFGHLSFDQWKQNQVVAVQYQDNGATRSAGLQVWDRPTDVPSELQFALAERMLATAPGPVRDSLNRERLRVRARIEGTPRLFVGSEDRVAKVELRDLAGRVRLRLLVDSSGVGRLVFLDSTGNQPTIFPPTSM